MGVKLVSASAGSVEIVAPATASNYTATMPAGTGNVVVNGINGSIVSGTAVNSTSGTSIDFTSIPSWVNRITVMLNGVSNTSGSQIQVQIGSGSVTTTGYSAYSIATAQTNAVLSTFSSTGNVFYSGTAAEATTAHMFLTRLTGNSWMSTHVGLRSGWGLNGAGNAVALGGALDRVRITSVSGTDTFDAGSINILYE